MGTNLRWSLANPFGINVDPAKRTWHAGHVNDVLELEETVRRRRNGGAGRSRSITIRESKILVGTDTGGVWLVSRGGDATPLSNNWDNPNITSLEFGPDGAQHVYASSGGNGALWVTDISTSHPLFSWLPIPLPVDTGWLSRVIVLKKSRRIVFASFGGLWWADIPSPDNSKNYVWNQVTPDEGLPSGVCYGLAEGPNETIVVTMPKIGIFYGGWINLPRGAPEVYIHKSAPITSVDVSIMAETSVASCSGDRRIIYAAGRDPQPKVVPGQGPVTDLMYALLSSKDGGKTWTNVDAQVTNNKKISDLTIAAGNQGDYNNCIAVSPVNSSMVALGWRGGPFISQDGGQNWQQYADSFSEALVGPTFVNPAIHADLHAVYFSPNGRRLYVCSDGGVIATDNLGKTFISTYNKHLANLQFESWPARQFYGTFSAWAHGWFLEGRYVLTGRVGGGLQDNGNVYCKFARSEPTPWRQVAYSDGMLGMFVAGGDYIFYNTSDHANPSLASSSGGALIDKGKVPIWPADKTGDRYVTQGAKGEPIVAEAIPAPALASSLDPKYMIRAVAAILTTVYGLFTDTPGNAHWEELGTIRSIISGDFIISVGSYDGLHVYVGTAAGRIFRLDTKDGTQVDMSPAIAGEWANITRIVVDASDAPSVRGYALCNTYPPLSTTPFGTILKLVNESLATRDTPANQGVWSKLSSTADIKSSDDVSTDALLYDIAVDWRFRHIYLATESYVYISPDDGVSWRGASHGLPRVPHCSGLCLVLPDTLLLSTYGRSLWVTRMSNPLRRTKRRTHPS
jgi:hypothetical protein